MLSWVAKGLWLFINEQAQQDSFQEWGLLELQGSNILSILNLLNRVDAVKGSVSKTNQEMALTAVSMGHLVLVLECVLNFSLLPYPFNSYSLQFLWYLKQRCASQGQDTAD